MGQSVQISASPSSGWAFAGWLGSGQGSYSGRNETRSVLVLGPIQETAKFDLALVVEALGGGSVQVVVGNSSYSVGGNHVTFYVLPDTKVTLVAKPGLLDAFAGWLGLPAGGVGAVVFTPRSPMVVAASFTINRVLVYGLAVLYFGFAVFAISYLLRNQHINWSLRGPTRRNESRYA